MSRLDISMGVTYKLRDEVVNYIISERQANPLLSCRQLAESASQRFGLNLSKSSVHDVLKESGIMTPRGRKPKDKFTIPHEKKKQIQDSLSQIKLTPVMPPEPVQEPALEPIVPAAPIQEIPAEPVIPAEPAPELPVEPASSEPSAPIEPKLGLIPDIAQEQPVSLLPSLPAPQPQPDPVLLPEEPIVLEARPPEEEISTEYEGAGAIFQKAAMWDLGIFSEEDIKETDWPYYLTYVKGVKLFLEDGQELFIPMPLPIERCIREVADGLVNHTRAFIAPEVSDQELFKDCMAAEPGRKITKISIVDQKNHNLVDFNDIVVKKIHFNSENVVFVESNQNNSIERLKHLFFTQNIENKYVIENILSLKGFDTLRKNEIVITLVLPDNYDNISIIEAAAQKLNAMFLRDEQGRLLQVKI